MKALYITLTVLIIIATLGFADVGMKFSDVSAFNYKSWNHLFLNNNIKYKF